MKKTGLITKTKTELLKLARRLGLRGVSTIRKAALIERIERARQKPAASPAGAAAPAAPDPAAKPLKRYAQQKRPAAAAAGPPAPPVPPATPRRKPARPRPPAPPAEEFSAHKFDVTPTRAPAPRQVFRDEPLGELPDSYGTGRLFLTARDPHWLYAYWDLTLQQMADYRKRSADGRLLLRVWEQNQPQPFQEVTLTHDARDWYLSVNKAAATFVAELGYLRRDGTFTLISRSGAATTPGEAVSADTTARFVTIPVEVPFQELVNVVRHHAAGGERLAEALQQLQAAGTGQPFQMNVALGPWTAQQAQQLERFVGGAALRPMQAGSFELSEALRRRLQAESSSGLAAGASPGGASWQQAPGQPPPGFWFAVNAELIIYGATEPDAAVTIDGQPITLRPDGTFAFHYLFPDGQYRLPLVAVSAQGDDQRAVQLQFERQTATHGEVGQVRPPEHRAAPAK